MINYFKQAWTIIRQEKFFSSVYIIGTGLSIAVVMVVSIVIYLNIANIYPETNRDRMLRVGQAMEEYKKGGMSSSDISLKTYKTCFADLRSAETATAICNDYGAEHYAQTPDGGKQISVEVKFVDTNFWTVFPFRFLSGKSFSEAEFESAINAVVISGSFSMRMFGTVEAEGRTVSINFKQYRVSGVVRDASFVTARVFAHVYFPYTLANYTNEFGQEGTLGPMNVYILAPSASMLDEVRNEALENVAKYDSSLSEDVSFSIKGQPDKQWQSIMRIKSNREPDYVGMFAIFGLVMLLMLLVPAVSLSGMTESRMERRMAEMGVRRAFGAPVSKLMSQVVWENFLFTFLGGLVGLGISYIIIIVAREWILQLSRVQVPPEGVDVVITPQMLFNFPVFGITLAVCFTLNLMSSLIPAWRAARQEIIHSLNSK